MIGALTDPLSEALGRLCMPRWKAGIVDFPANSVIEVASGYVGFYGIAAGRLRLQRPNGAPLASLEDGEFGLLPQGVCHQVTAGNGAHVIRFESLLAGELAQRSSESDTVRFVYGYFSLENLDRNPFLGVFPDVVLAAARSNSMMANSKSLIRWISDEQQARRTGWEVTVNRLVQVLFLQTLREHVANQHDVPSRANWVTAASDPVIGRVLTKIHDAPEWPWTVKSLAKETNMAKSAFSERFREVVGEPPLQYVTGFRIQKACELLRGSKLGVKEIAVRVGYESASSFSHAFKRLTGKSPADYRKSVSS